MNRSLFTVLFVCCITVGFYGCGDDDGDSNGGGGNPCIDQCQAQEDADCAFVPLADCQMLCNLIIGSLDADCRAKANAAFACNLENDEVCGGITDELVCREQTEAYSACLEAENPPVPG